MNDETFEVVMLVLLAAVFAELVGVIMGWNEPFF